ncbi:Uncharacterised protein [Shewanella algae]|uniref:Uncharacterized protein n=1 Tax=Shewanella algae TaxID=38313 RepID=A0A380BQB8_9GAMM|nr:Uncharacterised protein [Shewanella algae]
MKAVSENKRVLLLLLLPVVLLLLSSELLLRPVTSMIVKNQFKLMEEYLTRDSIPSMTLFSIKYLSFILIVARKTQNYCGHLKTIIAIFG